MNVEVAVTVSVYEEVWVAVTAVIAATDVNEVVDVSKRVAVTASTVTVLAVTPTHEQALAYLASPEQAEAYAGMVRVSISTER